MPYLVIVLWFPVALADWSDLFGIFTGTSFFHFPSYCLYLLVDSPNITAYGFIGINYDIETSFLKPETGSFYFFIPQIELNEYEGFSLLGGTMAWCDSSLCTFEEALHSYEASLFQASHHFSPMTGTYRDNLFKSTLQMFNVVECEKMHAVCMNAKSLGSAHSIASFVEMKDTPSSCQFCIRVSPTIAVATNMLDHAGETSFIPEDFPNINAVWASLIIEECYRLGLTYFCVAPGSRSSPLAVAASSHPHTTCISCFDERSLAFHAIGYARGSNTPAVVITTSGTAVSNLLPAIVEASQDFLPLLLLTADRPPELHEAGANQAINQVNHFGSYVRFFFNLPVPTDHIAARMVLTTVDSAVYRAISLPYGPVHMNCPFREPLENSPKKWLINCLDGLDSWISSAEPFTKYIQVQPSHSCVGTGGLMQEVMKLLKGAKRGLLLIGAIHTEDEIWASLILARHLSWPVVADILSGLRIRKLLTSYYEYEQNFFFIDYFDHVLLSDAVRKWIEADVIVQIGSKITSKRVSKMLEQCSPFSYIMVDKHPCRHDPSHIVTHRIQSTISQFVDCILRTSVQFLSGKWTGFLRALDTMVAWELSFQICSEYSLTEPHVAHEISEVLSSETALFVGNSMAIRDADMYCHGLVNSTSMMSQFALPCQWIKVAGNRGASGIDGLLSTATGFAVGCKKRVLCVIGDVSFLHDTNGLSILSSRMWRKPMTILVINNHGGAIFSFLPIAETTEPRILNEYFYCTHTISINKLCTAHGVKHILAKTKAELRQALMTSRQADSDCVIEVESFIDCNATFHSILKNCASQAASHTFSFLSRHSIPDSFLGNLYHCKINRMEYSLYRIKLSAPPTSVPGDCSQANLYRQGFILLLSLEDGSVGFGEVAPLDTHKESLLDIEEQLRFIVHLLKGATVSYLLPLFRGSFSSWIMRSLGVPLLSIFPSVRCGLEMAILNAISSRLDSSLLSILQMKEDKEEGVSEWPSVRICALVDCQGTPMEVANVAYKLVGDGFHALKLKVARKADPKEDAAAIKEIRKKVGPQIELRVDANRKWTYEQAVEFGSHVNNCDLQYIEEPVKNEDDIMKFCEETSLPVALDETIDNISGNIFEALARFTHSGIVAFVIKPSLVGGFENAALIARWAHMHGKMAIISAAFESSLSLSSYVQFACYLDLQNAQLCKALEKNVATSLAHGLGTYQWLKEDVTVDPLMVCQNPCSGDLEASILEADRLLRNFQINQRIILKNSTEEQVNAYQLNLESEYFSYTVEVQEIGESSEEQNDVVLFLHGFLGTGQDWIPIMKAISGTVRCISVDLPGHGKSKVQCCTNQDATEEHKLSVDAVAILLCKLIDYIAPRKVTLVGYSLGGRIALYMALRFSAKINGAVIISGSPGLRDITARKIRAAKDDSRARALISFGLRPFVETWYSGELWQSLREHPSFKQFVARRLQHDDVHSLARALSDLSIGRQIPLWEDLKQCQTPLLFIVGDKDIKFKNITQDIYNEVVQGIDGRGNVYEAMIVPNCGHAVHLENPLAIVHLVRQFWTRVRNRST
ncbi:hypothetical protein Nepgr_003672 [Nepenthes gracilis]|uniref:Mandelate racemase/muconate lactonizing enzyme C-terminal domain-containing protein n=1 Tax=Nepenthes gracilis TaxID=150966 RepID=A0AAD3S019_NEPGR|nr:hypothetical protein Nepgr_003672 [Nepenthes gracilis]